MPHPMTGPVLGFASRLRFPTLFKVTVGLMILSWLLPDPIPFIDEILTALATLVLANWKRSDPPPPAPPREPIEGESRRE
ncbi:MAG: DUF6116 family protein [Pseudoxanthomonas sp.]|nr:DUF6116 family protein [Pseudoxanthomonas sp.]